jgi:perosamine synthetase
MISRAVAHAVEWTRLQLGRDPLPPPTGLFDPVPDTIDAGDARLAQRWLPFGSHRKSDDETRAYMRSFAAWNGSAHAFAFAAGRVALSACIHALGLGPGDEVIVPGYTCVVVANAFDFAGVRPVWADIELDSYGLDADDFVRRIGPRTRAVVVQHLYGLVSRDFERVLELARARGLAVIEDCCHATGARFRGRRVGNFGQVAFYSSERSKIFSTNSGGIAVCNDAALARRMEDYYRQAALPDAAWTAARLVDLIGTHYRRHQADHPLRSSLAQLLFDPLPLRSVDDDELAGRCPPGYARKLPPALAVIGARQLPRIDGFNAHRRRWAAVWERWCRTSGYCPPLVIPDSEPVFLRYPVLVEPEKKTDRRWAAEELGVELGVWFASPLHPSPRPVPECPNAHLAVERCINLPCGVTGDAGMDAPYP